MSILEIDDLPEYWFGVVQTFWAWQKAEHDRFMRQSKRKSSTPTDIRSRKR